MIRFRISIALAVILAASMLAIGPVAAATVGPPTSLVGVSGNNQVALTWTSPTVGGNPAISDYTLEYSSNGGLVWTQFIHGASATASMTVTGLTNDVAYSFRVSAVNSSGTGTASATVSVTPVANHTANNPALFSACPTGLISSAGFTDTTAAAVDCVAHYGITTGTTATTYSPGDTVTRWQMALFLTRMAAVSGAVLGSGADQGFTDIGGKSSEIQTAINQIKQLGITVGKTATTFAPDDNVTREEMALFISRFLTTATVGPGGNTEYVTGSSGAKVIKSIDTDHNFTDLNLVYLWESQTSISNLWNLGVTDAQSSTVYEPRNDMTREAMATFMANALNHTNARPAGLVMQASTYRASGSPAVDVAITYRTDAFAPIPSVLVDTFKFVYNVDTTITSFSTTGACTGYVTVVTDGSKCQVSASDQSLDANGNHSFQVGLGANSITNLWAWTAATGTNYDNDIHATGASKITIETTA